MTVSFVATFSKMAMPSAEVKVPPEMERLFRLLPAVRAWVLPYSEKTGP